MIALWSRAAEAAAEYACRFTGKAAVPARVRIPARGAALGLFCAGAEPDRPLPRETLLGAPLFSRVEKRDGWLLFTLSDAFYSAALDLVQTELPPAREDLGNHALNRALSLSRKGGEGCPAFPPAQRALWLGLGLLEADAKTAPAHRLSQTEKAVEELFISLPPAARGAVAGECGAWGDALARILFSFLSSRR